MREIRGKFMICDKFKYLNLVIKESSIKEAGMGVYATTKIPKGAIGIYVGVKKKKESSIDPLYSWRIYEETEGVINYDVISHFIDAKDERRSNWTRYVNCGSTSKSNNMIAKQCSQKILYIASRNIRPGEELFIDYGEEYRNENLGIKY